MSEVLLQGDHIVTGFQVGLTFVIWDGRGLREHLGRRGTPSYPNTLSSIW